MAKIERAGLTPNRLEDDAPPVTLKEESDIPQQADCASSESDQTGHLNGSRFWIVLATLTLVITLTGLDYSIIGVAVPAITEQFQTSADVAWYNTAFRLAACSSQFLFGKLYCHLQLRWLFCTAIAILLLGSVLSATANSSAVFVVGRALAGMGAAGSMGGVFTVLIVIAPLSRRPMLTGILSGLEGVAIAIAPIIGGVLTQETSWRWCFYINLPIGGTALVFLAIFLPSSRVSSSDKLKPSELIRTLDLIGNGLLTLALICLFMVLSWAGTRFAWQSPQIIVLLAIFALSFILFLFDQHKAGDGAILPPRLWKKRTVVAAAMLSFCLNAAQGVLEYYLPIYWQIVSGYSSSKAGYLILPLAIGYNIALVTQGFFTTWLGYFNPFAILCTMLMPIGAGLILTWNETTGLAPIIIHTALFGVGCGFGFEVPQIAVQTVLSDEDSPLGLSMTLFTQNFGPAFCIAVAQQIFTSRLVCDLTGKVVNLSASQIADSGLSDLSSLDGQSPAVLTALLDAFRHIWYITLAVACLSVFGAFGLEWRSVIPDARGQDFLQKWCKSVRFWRRAKSESSTQTAVTCVDG